MKYILYLRASVWYNKINEQEGMLNTMKLLNFGSCNIDYVYLMDHIVKPGETESVGEMQIFPAEKGLINRLRLRARAQAYITWAL